MDSKDKNFVINNNISPKLNLCYNTSLIEEDDKNPLIQLLNNFEEITSIINANDFNYIKALYMNRSRVHEILYSDEAIIDIKTENNENLIVYIYLSLLIEENPYIIDYSYSADLIEKIKYKAKTTKE